MPQFLLKPDTSLTEQDFLDYPAWADYYEPDEIELLLRLGFDVNEVRIALEDAGPSGEYSFALPTEGCREPFKHLKLSVRVLTPGGTHLVGYRTSVCVAVFHRGKLYLFNRSLRSESIGHAQHLAGELGEASIFPLEVCEVATTKRYSYTL